MTNYLAQLISDMHKAAENLPAKPYIELSENEECLQGVIEWENAEPKPMQEWFGINKENFPPATKLTTEQLKLMVDEIQKLWAAYNFEAALPDKLPVDIAYTVLVNYFEKPVIWVSEGMIGIEFCDYEPENCPFPPEFCMCTDFEDDDGYSLDNTAEIAALEKEINDFLSDASKGFQPVVEMEQYVGQLIHDLNTLTEKVKQEFNIPDNIDIRSARDQRMLIGEPYVTLETLSGIKAPVFPEHVYLDGVQNKKLLMAMLRLLDAYRIKIHYPKDLPPEFKYEALIEGWDTAWVKHLPDSGDDLELCTGDPMTCPFGEYCDCGDEPGDFEDEGPQPQEDMDDDIDLPF